jgi:hypothetical protein
MRPGFQLSFVPPQGVCRKRPRQMVSQWCEKVALCLAACCRLPNTLCRWAMNSCSLRWCFQMYMTSCLSRMNLCRWRDWSGCSLNSVALHSAMANCSRPKNSSWFPKNSSCCRRNNYCPRTDWRSRRRSFGCRRMRTIYRLPMAGRISGTDSNLSGVSRVFSWRAPLFRSPAMPCSFQYFAGDNPAF